MPFVNWWKINSPVIVTVHDVETMSSPPKKILTLSSLTRVLQKLRRQGTKIAFTNGCFDILHFGHVSYLQEAAKGKNRVLVVAINSDESVRTIKGEGRPIVPQKERAALIAALACVDYVTIFNEPTPLKVIETLKPDVLIKGADWKGKEVAGADFVKSHGGRLEFIKYIAGFSTTQLIESIKEKCF